MLVLDDVYPAQQKHPSYLFGHGKPLGTLPKSFKNYKQLDKELTVCVKKKKKKEELEKAPESVLHIVLTENASPKLPHSMLATFFFFFTELAKSIQHNLVQVTPEEACV